MGQQLQNTDKISFVVDVLAIKNGRKLGRVRPDDNGYYTIPLAVLGTVTDNRTYYEVEDFVAQITGENTFFNRCLRDGKCFGEYGHPEIFLLPESQQIERLLKIFEKNVSHQIGKVWTGDKLETGGRIVYGLIKPSGPYGDTLKQSLDDPCLNTAFSLRSVASSVNQNGVTRRRIKALVTFDYVCAGGYSEAAKRYAPGVESAKVEIILTTQGRVMSTSAMETLTDTELNEIFGAKTITIGTKRTTFLDKEGLVQDPDGARRTVYTSLLGKSLS